MKQKMMFLTLTILFIMSFTTLNYSAAVTITNPDNGETITISSGTTRSINFSWSYVVDPGTDTWSFSTTEPVMTIDLADYPEM